MDDGQQACKLVDKMKGWGERVEMKEGEAKVSRRQRRTAGENGRDGDREATAPGEPHLPHQLWKK